MSPDYSGEELINIAIDIERRGIMFYDVMALSTDDDKTRAIFQGLARMERVHLATFEQMLDEVEKAPPEEDREREGTGYIESLLDDAVFTDDLITGEVAIQADSDIKAMNLAISAEKDSILYYYEIRDRLPQSLALLVNRVLSEEKRHLEQLTVIKKDME
ncbi:MAG: hypothetical protein MUO19_07585, partial [Dehalococcoidales bacterium]|nr:hypothetical protein [Dehalococcoidales bacterium]